MSRKVETTHLQVKSVKNASSLGTDEDGNVIAGDGENTAPNGDPRIKYISKSNNREGYPVYDFEEGDEDEKYDIYVIDSVEGVLTFEVKGRDAGSFKVINLQTTEVHCICYNNDSSGRKLNRVSVRLGKNEVATIIQLDGFLTMSKTGFSI
ncbi:hypothetical protein F7644_09545 [Tenacibaculum finnmarkense genomovar ulcerans]|uniref:hypothetical protein n=1 Tax=Tenacibaculum finnmarkense TaxID=2781243 RepID=UPI00187B67FE|nr:hypothetical protein [Tenacibaculum finnmarkense]MBE7646230.1 hypothetical protein [Tenacibaculum finnmarkense genomovar ulcerans]